jgi:hypothetical protein
VPFYFCSGLYVQLEIRQEQIVTFLPVQTQNVWGLINKLHHNVSGFVLGLTYRKKTSPSTNAEIRKTGETKKSFIEQVFFVVGGW